MTNADGSSSLIRATLTCGMEGSGNPPGSAPNRDWIVSTGQAKQSDSRRSRGDHQQRAGEPRSEPAESGDAGDREQTDTEGG